MAPALEEAARRVWEATRRRARAGRTVTIKLKTADFRILTRRTTPPRPPASAEELAGIALALLPRVEEPPATRYRLAGVGLSNFPDEEGEAIQPGLFDDSE